MTYSKNWSMKNNSSVKLPAFQLHYHGWSKKPVSPVPLERLEESTGKTSASPSHSKTTDTGKKLQAGGQGEALVYAKKPDPKYLIVVKVFFHHSDAQKEADILKQLKPHNERNTIMMLGYKEQYPTIDKIFRISRTLMMR